MNSPLEIREVRLRGLLRRAPIFVREGGQRDLVAAISIAPA
jgi:hypothetical protein